MGDGEVGEIGVRFNWSPDPLLLKKPSLHRDSNYSIYEVDVFYHLFIDSASWPQWLRQSGPEFGLFYANTRGNSRNENSTRDQIGLMVGYRQNILNYLSLAVEFGMDYSGNRLNFGEGTQPYRQESMNLHFQVSGGLRHCFYDLVCASVMAGYQREDAVAGQPAYFSQGFQVAAALSVILSSHDPVVRVEEKEEPKVIIREEPRCLLSPYRSGANLLGSRVIEVSRGVQWGARDTVPVEIQSELDGVAAYLSRQEPSVKVFVRIGGVPVSLTAARVQSVRGYLNTKLQSVHRVVSDAHDQYGNICLGADSLQSGLTDRSQAREVDSYLVELQFFQEVVR